ncbi:MAG TPA: hypothetical protein VNV43_06140 [Candidatus Acidoferrales bacterium]|jgi:hypothetical protein|nr:hypothetical protein [Candidatus Acidoferrales bacterium]
MESEKRGALGLVRLVAACVILIGLLDGGIYFTQYLMPYAGLQPHAPKQHLPPVDILRIVLDSLPIIAGIVILIKAKAIAEWLADWID